MCLREGLLKFKKKGNIVFICLIALFIMAGLARTIIFPKDVNYYENRYSKKILAPTAKNILDSTFQNSIEEALADQIPFAQRFKKFYNDVTSGFSSFWITPILNENDDVYINYKSGIKIFGGYYVYGAYELESVKSGFQTKAQNYNAIFKKYPDIEFYVYYIERDVDLDLESGEKVNMDEYLFSLLDLDASRKRSFEIDSFEEFAEYFYKTDHHWKHKGSYVAYKDVAKFLGCEGEFVKAGKEVLISKEFAGSKASTAGSNMITEPFYAYEYEFPTFKSITGELGEYGKQQEILSMAPVSSISYGEYYGSDDGEVIFDTGKENLDNILVIGESFDNAILKLLATHFNKTHSIDLRTYEHYQGSKFDFEKYVEEKNIDKVLFIGNVNFYDLSTFVLENY